MAQRGRVVQTGGTINNIYQDVSNMVDISSNVNLNVYDMCIDCTAHILDIDNDNSIFNDVTMVSNVNM